MRIANKSLTINQTFPRTGANNDKWILLLGVLYLILNYLKPILDILFNYSPLITHFGRFIGFLLIIQAIIKQDFRYLLLKEKRYVIYLFFFTMVVILSTLFSTFFFSNDDLSAMASGLFNIGSAWVVYMIFMYLSFREKNAKFLLWFLALLAILNSTVGLYGSFTGQSIMGMTREGVGVGAFGYDPTSGRSGGLRGENYVGLWNVPALAFGLFLLYRKYIFRVLGVVFVLVSMLAIVASLSRTSVVCGVVEIIISLVFLFRKKKFWRIIFVCIVFLLVLSSAQILLVRQSAYFSPYVRDDIQRRWHISNIIENERRYIWTEYLKASFVSPVSPIVGQGPGYIDQEFSMGKRVPHNSFLDVFVEYGFLGLFLYFIPFILSFRSLMYLKNKRHQDIYGWVFCAIFFGMATALLTLSNPFLKIVWIVAGCLQGRTFVMKRSSLQAYKSSLSTFGEDYSRQEKLSNV